MVDDDPSIRRMLAAIVAAAGFACDVAGDLLQARERLTSFSPDIILLDLELGGESGLVLVETLAPRADSPPVLIISGHDEWEVARAALDAGALGYLTKPFKASDITIAIRDALRRHRESGRRRAERERLEDRVVERTAFAQDALERLRRANEETVRRISRAIEFRDPETGAHIERMSQYCALLSTRFGLDPDVMRVASRLHDVGKIATPDAILLKPGPLTSDERAEMQRHAAIGHRMLRGSDIELLDFAAIIAWTHHERYDGKGYPRGLAGGDIPLAGRIAGVADVFDALTTDRVYRRAMPVDEAVVVLRSQGGRHFDPVVLDAFLDELERVREIMARFGDEVHDRQEATPSSGEMLSVRDAANALGISTNQLRRWSDTGRIEADRTEGGHRRFPVAAIRALADRRGVSTRVRPLSPPTEPLPVLAEILLRRGPQLVATATDALYRGTEPGWFAAEHSAAARAKWLMALERGSRAGRYDRALRISDEFLRRACTQAVGLLERHSFLELFARAAVRAATHAGAAQPETVATRRLFVALQQAQLSRHT